MQLLCWQKFSVDMVLLREPPILNPTVNLWEQRPNCLSSEEFGFVLKMGRESSFLGLAASSAGKTEVYAGGETGMEGRGNRKGRRRERRGGKGKRTGKE